MIEEILENSKIFIENEIDRLYPQISNLAYSNVIDASRYSLTMGGKRIRPAIMLEFCKLFGGEVKNVANFAVALEMIHTYSLIHDDLPCMDNDDFRRGNPSCHIKFGEDTALLAGDTLLTESFNIALSAPVSDSKKVRAISVMAKRSGLHGMIGGQVMDLSFEKSVPSLENLFEMCRLKTGCLISAAAEIGAIIGGANDNEIESASEYAFNLGVAFQIIDDILDVVGDENLLGKPIGSDKDNQKNTFITYLGIEKARQKAENLTDKAIEILHGFKQNTENLQLLTEYLLARNY